MSNVNRIINVDNVNQYNNNIDKMNSDNKTEFSSYLGETKSLDKIFNEAAAKYNVPVELLKAIGKAESNFNANAVSRAGAQGVMQLMPATAKGLGVTNSFDPEQNIMGGSKYIAGLLKKYDGNTSLALAAYNAGSGNVAKYDGIPPFKETQNYVKKVLKYYGQGNIEITAANTSTKGNTFGAVANNFVGAVSVPTPTASNLSYLLTGSISEDTMEDLQAVFSYDEYLAFLDGFLEEEKKEETEKPSNISASDINYSAPILNLLVEQKLI